MKNLSHFFDDDENSRKICEIMNASTSIDGALRELEKTLKTKHWTSCHRFQTVFEEELKDIENDRQSKAIITENVEWLKKHHKQKDCTHYALIKNKTKSRFEPESSYLTERFSASSYLVSIWSTCSRILVVQKNHFVLHV